MKNTAKFRQKVVLMLVCFALIPALVTGFCASLIATNNLVQMRRETYLRQFQNSQDLFRDEILDMNQKILEIYCSDVVQNDLNRDLDEGQALEIYDQLRSICNRGNFGHVGILMMGVYGNNGTVFTSDRGMLNKFASVDQVAAYLVEKQIVTIDSWSFTDGITDSKSVSLVSGKVNNQRLINIKVIRTLDQLEFCGYIVSVVDTSFYGKVIPEVLTGDMGILLDESGNVIYGSGVLAQWEQVPMESFLMYDEENGEPLWEGSHTVRYQNERYLVNYSYIPSVRCYQMSLVRYETLIAPTDDIIVLTLLVILLSSAISVVVAILVMRSMMRPLDRIAVTMDQVKQGDLTARFAPTADDELNRLGVFLNQMLSSTEENIRDMERITRSKQESDRKLLQAQINPHLIYNSLNSLKGLARVGDNTQLAHAIDQMSAFYRISLSSGKDIISVEEELKHVQAYVSLQNICFGKHIDLKIDVDEQVKDNVILKMTLQPIVENALLHGLSVYNLEGTVSITSRLEEDRLVLCVQDSGVGVYDDTLRRLNELFSNGISTDQNAFGLSNINSRLNYYFGKSFGLHIESEPLEFTRVEISLPRQTLGGWNEKNHHSG